MSYDFLVFGRGEQVEDALDQALTQLHCERGPAFRGVSREVRGRRVAAFTVDGPFLVEPEDVPGELRARVVAPTVTVQVSVPGHTAKDVALAKRVARRPSSGLEPHVADGQSTCRERNGWMPWNWSGS